MGNSHSPVPPPAVTTTPGSSTILRLGVVRAPAYVSKGKSLASPPNTIARQGLRSLFTGSADRRRRSKHSRRQVVTANCGPERRPLRSPMTNAICREGATHDATSSSRRTRLLAGNPIWPERSAVASIARSRWLNLANRIGFTAFYRRKQPASPHDARLVELASPTGSSLSHWAPGKAISIRCLYAAVRSGTRIDGAR